VNFPHQTPFQSDGVAQTRNYYRRVVTPWDLSATREYLIAPERGHQVVALSLGPNDQSGGVRVVTEDVEGADASSQPLGLDPLAPLIVRLIKPFKVVPITTTVAGTLTTIQHLLDLFVWYDWLPWSGFARRAVTYQRGTALNGVISPTPGNIAWVSGKKRVTLTIGNVGIGGVTNVAISVLIPTTVGTQQVQVWVGPLVGGQGAILEFNSGLLTVTSGGAPGNPITLNYPTQMFAVVMGNTDAGAGHTYDWNVEARDY
jgi:hypothetical protein